MVTGLIVLALALSPYTVAGCVTARAEGDYVPVYLDVAELAGWRVFTDGASLSALTTTQEAQRTDPRTPLTIAAADREFSGQGFGPLTAYACPPDTGFFLFAPLVRG